MILAIRSWTMTKRIRLARFVVNHTNVTVDWWLVDLMVRKGATREIHTCITINLDNLPHSSDSSGSLSPSRVEVAAESLRIGPLLRWMSRDRTDVLGDDGGSTGLSIYRGLVMRMTVSWSGSRSLTASVGLTRMRTNGVEGVTDVRRLGRSLSKWKLLFTNPKRIQCSQRRIHHVKVLVQWHTSDIKTGGARLKNLPISTQRYAVLGYLSLATK